MTTSEPDLYTKSYEKFFAHTNEKTMFVDEFSNYINKYEVRSMLDIGPGNGDLAIPVSKKAKSPKY